MDTQTSYVNSNTSQATTPISESRLSQPAIAPQPAAYAPSGAYSAQPPARSMAPFLIGGIVVLLLLAMAGIGVVAAGWFAIDRAISQIPSAQMGPETTVSSEIPVGSAKSVKVDLEMGAGSLNLDSATRSADLFSGNFTYNVPAWEPKIAYNDSTGSLTVHQSNMDAIVKGSNTTMKNQWDLHLNSGVPTSLRAQMGAGESVLRLGGLALTDLNVSTGAARLTVDLTGKWTQSLQATIDGGVGETTIIVPSDTGVRITAQGGLGNIKYDGLSHDGKVYTNAAYGKSATTLDISVQVGVGTINLQQK